MIRIVLLLSVCVLCFSCSTTSSNELDGTWKLIENQIDIGNGVPKYVEAPTQILLTINDGIITSSSSFCSGIHDNKTSYVSKYNASTKTIIPNDCPNQEVPVRYALENDYLIISPACIETCKSKYQRVE